jgi:hypothetical protein
LTDAGLVSDTTNSGFLVNYIRVSRALILQYNCIYIHIIRVYTISVFTTTKL